MLWGVIHQASATQRTMICRTLDLVNLSPSSQFYASDDDSADYSGDDAMLSDLFAQTQETSEDTLVDDTAAPNLFAQTQETNEDTLVDDTAAPSHASAAAGDDTLVPSHASAVAGDDTLVPSHASAVAGDETTVPSHASAVADVASGVSEDPYCDAAETVGPMKTSCVDEEDVDFFKRQVELSDDDDDDSDKESEFLL